MYSKEIQSSMLHIIFNLANFFILASVISVFIWAHGIRVIQFQVIEAGPYLYHRSRSGQMCNLWIARHYDMMWHGHDIIIQRVTTNMETVNSVYALSDYKYVWIKLKGHYLILSEKINYHKSIIAMVEIITYCNNPIC